MEEELRFDCVNLFLIIAFKFRVERIEKEELNGLAEFLVSKHPLVEGVEVPLGEKEYDGSIVEAYLKERGLEITEDNKLYTLYIIFRHTLMEGYIHIDEEKLDPNYLQQRPFIRLKLRRFSLRIPEDAKLSGEAGKLLGRELDCHPFAMIHRLGVVVLTVLIEIPFDVNLSVSDINSLIDLLTDIIKKKELLYIFALEVILPLLSRRTFGKYSIKELTKDQKEDLLKEAAKKHEYSPFTWVIYVWKPGEEADYFIKTYPLQLSSLSTGGNWRLESRHSAEKDLKEILVHSARDKIILAGIRGVCGS
jgi:hypothetical protein